MAKKFIWKGRNAPTLKEVNKLLALEHAEWKMHVGGSCKINHASHQLAMEIRYLRAVLAW